MHRNLRNLIIGITATIVLGAGLVIAATVLLIGRGVDASAELAEAFAEGFEEEVLETEEVDDAEPAVGTDDPTSDEADTADLATYGVQAKPHDDAEGHDKADSAEATTEVRMDQTETEVEAETPPTTTVPAPAPTPAPAPAPSPTPVPAPVPVPTDPVIDQAAIDEAYELGFSEGYHEALTGEILYSPILGLEDHYAAGYSDGLAIGTVECMA